MASITSNAITSGLSGRFGDSLVFKTMRGKTFVTTPSRIPDKRKESASQRSTRTNFQEASQWAQLILLDPERKAYYRQRAKALKLPNAYTAALTDFMRKANIATTRNDNTITYSISKTGFSLQQVNAVTDEESQIPAPNVLIRKRNDRWIVHQTIDHSTTQPITLLITDSCERTILYKATG